MSILQLIASDNFITVNRSLVKLVGLDAAVLLGEFASEASYWESKGEMENGFFYSTIENIEEKTSLSKYLQASAIERLKEFGLIETEKRGLPAKRYVKLNEENILKVFDHKKSKNLTTVSQKIGQQEVQKLDGNKKKTNKTKEEDKRKESKTGFDAILDSVQIIRENPSLRETIVEYIKMRKLIKKPLTDRAMKMNINDAYKLANGDPSTMQAIIEQSIKNSWAGVYELKEQNRQKKQAVSDDFWESAFAEARQLDEEDENAKRNPFGFNESLDGLLPEQV